MLVMWVHFGFSKHDIGKTKVILSFSETSNKKIDTGHKMFSKATKSKCAADT